MRKIVLLTAMLTLVLASSTLAAGLSGTWTLTWWGAGAEESFPLDIKAAGENLTITGTHPSFGEMTGAGTLKGDSVSITLKSSSMEIALTGKLAGNKMEGTREIKASGEGRGGGAAAGGAQQGGGMPGGAGGGQGGASPQGGMPGGTGGAQGGAPPQGGMSGGGGAPGGDQGGAPGGGQAVSDQGNENWTAVKN